MSKKNKVKKPVITVTEENILIVAERFGITDFYSQGKKYFARYWTSDRMLSHHKPCVCDFKTMENSINGSFINPVFEMKDGTQIGYDDLFAQMTCE